MTTNDDMPTTRTFTFTSDETFAENALENAFTSRLAELTTLENRRRLSLAETSERRALAAFVAQLNV